MSAEGFYFSTLVVFNSSLCFIFPIDLQKEDQNLPQRNFLYFLFNLV